MWTIAIIAVLFVMYSIISDHYEHKHTQNLHPANEHSDIGYDNDHFNLIDTNRNFYDPYHRDHYRDRGPIFSPDRRHIWDGEKWVENESGAGMGIVIGIVIGFAIFYFLNH